MVHYLMNLLLREFTKATQNMLIYFEVRIECRVKVNYKITFIGAMNHI